jgi:hypothetical protein
MCFLMMLFNGEAISQQLPTAPGETPSNLTLPKFPVKLYPADKVRLSKIEENRKKAIAEAFKSKDAALVSDLKEVLSGSPQLVQKEELLGSWRCRTLKLGGISSLLIYPSFSCRISEKKGKLIFHKTTGSQRTRGQLYRISDTQFIYIGAGYYGYEKPKTYGALAERNEVAFFYKISPERIRLEFPAPHFESEFDIIELAR